MDLWLEGKERVVLFYNWKHKPRTSWVVRWLRLHTPNAGSLGSIPGQGTRSHMPQLRVCMLQQRILHAAMKTQHSQKNKLIFKTKQNKPFCDWKQELRQDEKDPGWGLPDW